MKLQDYVQNKPVLETEQLILRPLRKEDVTDLKECAAQNLFTYFAGGLVQNIPDRLQDGFVKRELPAGEYIVCRVEAENFEDLVTVALDQASKYLFGIWLPRHNLITEPFSAEKYYRDLEGMACMEIWVKPLPLKNKG